MKQIAKFIPVISIVFLIVGYAVLRYYGKWENYQDKALFLNTYAYSDDQTPGKSTWHWVMDPTPVSDGIGHMILVDFSSNMLAVIVYPDGDPKSFNWSAKLDTFATTVANQHVTIHRQSDELVSADGFVVRTIRPLHPGEAQSIFNNLQQNNSAAGRPQMQFIIQSLLGPPATQPAAGASPLVTSLTSVAPPATLPAINK